MTYNFEVIAIRWHHNRGNFILAKHLGDYHNIDISEGSLFGDIAIYQYEGMRNLTHENDTKKTEIFVFCPTSMKWLKDNHFLVGQKVQLIVSDKAN